MGDCTIGMKRWATPPPRGRRVSAPQAGISRPMPSRTISTNTSRTAVRPVMPIEVILGNAIPREPNSRWEGPVVLTRSFPASAIRMARSTIARRAPSFGRRLALVRLLHGSVISILVQSVCIVIPIRRRTVFLSVVSRTNPAGGGGVLFSLNFFCISFAFLWIVLSYFARKRSLQNSF